MTNQRILIIAGVGKSLINFRGHLIKALDAAGHDVHVAAPGLCRHADLRTQLDKLGATAHEVALSRSGTNPLKDLLGLLALYRLMRAIQPDLVLAYTIKPVVWGGIAARIARVPEFFALITGLGYAFTGTARGKRAIIRRLLLLLYRTSLRRSAGVIFQNPDDKAEFSSRRLLPPASRTRIVNGSGVDTAHFHSAPLPDGPIRFLLIARLLGDKGICEFVDAARLLRSRGLEAEFHLVGPLDANPTGLPESRVRAWHDEGVISWHGAVPDVRPAIAAAHVFVLPSYREGTPRSVLEAMSMGRPIITTDAPGCRETVVAGANGYLVPVRNAEALADAMTYFIRQPVLVARMGAVSRKVAEEKYDVHKVNAQMMEAMGLIVSPGLAETNCLNEGTFVTDKTGLA